MIVEILIEFSNSDGVCFDSKVRFVDLAGSEKVNMDGKDMMQEGANINRSLLALTNCINILSDKTQSKNSNFFVPFRNSKLTRILKESLDGSKPVMMIVCLSPNGIFVEETLNSIKYAEKAKNIKRCDSEIQSRIWSRMKIYKEEDYQKRIDDLERENSWLRNMVKSKVKESVQSLKMTSEMCHTCRKNPDILKSFEIFPGEDNLTEKISEVCSTNEEIIRLRMNIDQLDQIIKFNDSEINSIQNLIDDLEVKGDTLTPRGQYQQDDKLTLMYEDLTMLADKLEENLDLKEDMITELRFLDSRAENAKIFIQRIFQDKQETVGKLNKRFQFLRRKLRICLNQRKKNFSLIQSVKKL